MARAREGLRAAAPPWKTLRAQGLPHAARGDGLNLWIPLPADDQPWRWPWRGEAGCCAMERPSACRSRCPDCA